MTGQTGGGSRTEDGERARPLTVVADDNGKLCLSGNTPAGQ